ncbi:MAG: general secretion pathway protein GspK [Phycisphaerales bacterium]|nr:MAG: general secretion pathway protein GspK [Phycisphaerales bacterium]
MNNDLRNQFVPKTRRGVVLLVTLVLLVVLATLAYTLTGRVAAQRRRNQYIIDYSAARYACDSAVKYSLATLEEIDPQLISRPNEPDFSDLFALDDVQYNELLAQWGLGPAFAESGGDKRSAEKTGLDDANDPGYGDLGAGGFNDPDYMPIRGPYGARWPFVTEPVEFEIGSAKVRIEIEDENAKYPLGWALLGDPKIEREVDAGFVTFCELARLDAGQIDALGGQLAEVGKIKPFRVDFKPIRKTVKVPAKKTTSSKSRTTGTTKAKTYRKPISISASQQYSEQTVHFAKLFHSSLIDTEALARPTIVTESRKESPLRYIGIWGSRKVNVNTAPRHVLEAAFIYGGNQVEIAEMIIQFRREKVFGTIDELKNELFRYSDSIDKCSEYITTTSRFFTIRITATSGSAKASSIIAVTKDGDTVKRVAAING